MPKYGDLTPYTFDGQTVPSIKLSIPFPPKVAYVRLPSTADMLEYFESQKKDPNNLKTTAEEKMKALFEKIRLDQGEAFDEYEAESCITSLVRSRGVRYERTGDTYVITVETPFGNTDHTLGIPTQKQIALYRRNATKNYLNGIMTFYSELVKSIEGYAESITPKEVPAYHQLDCINQVFAALESIDPILQTDPNV